MGIAALDPDTQARWDDWLLAHTRRAFRILLWLLIAFYAGFAPLDLAVTPPAVLAPYWGVRAAVILASLACLRLARSVAFDRQPALFTAGYLLAVIVTSLNWMVAQLADPLAVFSGALGTAMVSLGAALMFLWPPRVVVGAHALFVAPFLVEELFGAHEGRWELRVPSAFFVLMAAVVAVVAQSLHWRSRRDQVAAQVRVERLERAERESRVTLEAQAVELASANERLRELDRLKTDLIANVSHDLRTPLTLILTALDELEQKVPEGARGIVDMGERNAYRLLQLIDDLLALARLDAADARVRSVRFDLAALVRDLAAAFRSGVGRTLETQGLDEPVPVCGDPHLLASAVSNLVANALKFTERPVPRVELRLSRQGGQAVLEVEDDGVGIAPEHLDRIFERFTQVDSGSGRRFPGSGIGLAVVREVVRAHGGTVAVRSRPGAGSTFTVTLPLAADGEAVAFPCGELVRRVAATLEP